MISALKALFEVPPQETAEELQHRLALTAAALLIETARADFVEDETEQAALEDLLVSSLGVARNAVHELVKTAAAQVEEATSLYDYTRVINDHFSALHKLRLIDAMWAVAYADGNIDKYEEHLIRQVAELTYVPHQDYIRAKLIAGKAAENG